MKDENKQKLPICPVCHYPIKDMLDLESLDEIGMCMRCEKLKYLDK